MSNSKCTSSECLWSANEAFCKTLQQTKIPLDTKWPLLVLQLRGVADDPTLNSEQKAAMQEILIQLFEDQSFSDAKYTATRKRMAEVMSAPYISKINEISAEVEKIAAETNRVLGKHKEQVQFVAETVEKDIESGKEPLAIISSLRQTLKRVIVKLEEDTSLLQELSFLDGLTGLANRRSFDSYFEETFELAREKRMPAALLIFDIDLFKGFNDEYGHLVGDQVLVALATLLKKSAALFDRDGKNILVARFGGDEFAVVIRGTKAADAPALAEKIRYQVASSSLKVRDAQGGLLQSGLKVTVSMGLAFFEQNGIENSKSFFDLADKALYKAKEAGRNCVVQYQAWNNNKFIVQVKKED